METELKNAVGKSVGEVMRDLADFVSTPMPIALRGQTIDLCALTSELNMQEQLAFALMSEALMQGWDISTAASFVRNALSSTADAEPTERVLSAFREPAGEAYKAMQLQYGNIFSISGGGYWSTVLAVGIDADAIPSVMQYLRAFVVALLEFAYMGDANPTETYAWGYYESFHRILDDLLQEPAKDPLPLKIRAIGGTAGKREGDAYPLSLGIDIENPNPDRMARGIEIDVTLKDKNGETVALLRDRVSSIDPKTVYHFGVTKRIRGAAVASIAASAKVGSYLYLNTPIMKHIRLENVRCRAQNGETRISADLCGGYDVPISSLAASVQLLTADNKLLGGSTEWCFEGIAPNESRALSFKIPVEIKNAQKLLYSVDFDALELIK